jgi:TadE-like protein
LLTAASTVTGLAMKILKFLKQAMRIGRDQSGLALTEFALAFPFMMTLSIGFVEFGRYANAHTRVSQIAMSVADNTGRIRQTIDITDVDAAMLGAKLAGEGIDFGEHGRVILSMIEENGQAAPNAGQRITWQRCYGAKVIASSYGVAGAGSTNASFSAGFGPAGRKIQAVEDVGINQGVMLVEVSYDYEPMFPISETIVDKLRGKTITATAAYPVRERDNNALQNGESLPTTNARHRLCSTYSPT